jgi:D-galactarolactone cycloisomerase
MITHMKITAVETHPLRTPVARPFVSGKGLWYRARSALVVRVRTDEGVDGWGEAYGPIEVTTPFVEKLLGPAAVGCDPFAAGVLWQRLYARFRDQDPRGSLTACLSALDIACWDVMGKAAGRPVHDLLGGAQRRRFRPYATGLYFKSEDGDHAADAVAEAAGYAEQGFPAVKMKVALPPREEAARVAAVRRALGPSVELMVDANHAYEVGSALSLGRALAAEGVLWFEEPILPDDLAGYATLRSKLDLQLAGGENLYGAPAFREVMERRAMDIVQPDLTAMGGFTEMRKVAALAEAFNVRLIPHIWGTGIGLFAALQVMAALPEHPWTWRPEPVWMEYEQTDNPLRDELVQERVEIRDGWVELPASGPGLGITVDEAALERYRA